MQQASPATPETPVSATPGSTPQVITTPPATAPAAQEGKVTITTEQFSQLTRDAARGRSAQKRASLGGHARQEVPAGTAPDAAQAINDANERAEAAERIALQEQVRGQVRDLLNKDEFKSVPKSTKELIIRNPSVITNAPTVEEAMLDIEDYVRDNVIVLDLGLGSAGGGTPAATAATPAAAPARETPPTGGTHPAPAGTPQLEDISKLTGTARSQAAIRNALKTGATKA